MDCREGMNCMNRLFTCRRTFVAVFAICCLTGLGLYLGDTSVASSIAIVAVGIAGANSYEKRGNSDKRKET